MSRGDMVSLLTVGHEATDMYPLPGSNYKSLRSAPSYSEHLKFTDCAYLCLGEGPNHYPSLVQSVYRVGVRVGSIEVSVRSTVTPRKWRHRHMRSSLERTSTAN